MARFTPTDEPTSWRRQDSMDIALVMSGEIAHLLDDGHEIILRADDVLVQNGTRHAWHNRGHQPVTLGVTSLGGFRGRSLS
jgi:quercetin dioxygenase-like cupin family protein